MSHILECTGLSRFPLIYFGKTSLFLEKRVYGPEPVLFWGKYVYIWYIPMTTRHAYVQDDERVCGVHFFGDSADA